MNRKQRSNRLVTNEDEEVAQRDQFYYLCSVVYNNGELEEDVTRKLIKMVKCFNSTMR